MTPAAMLLEFRASLPDILEGRDPLDMPWERSTRDRRVEYYRAKIKRIEAKIANRPTEQTEIP